MGSRGFWQELKRRHVYRVAAAYAVVGWLLIQVVTQVFPIFHLPDWIDQAIVLLILVGFPIVLVLAWAFDATLQGVVRTDAATEDDVARVPLRHRSRRAGIAVGAIGVLIALIAGGLYWHFGRRPAPVQNNAPATTASVGATPNNDGSGPGARAPAVSSPPASVATSIGAHPVPAKSIAVLPFENLSTDKGNAYFADGMQDLILTKLADIGDLKVISRTSTAKYASHPDDLKTIGQQLGVATILEGSVQKAGKQVLINVQLIDAKTDSHIWAQSYQRTLDNIFGVEGEVAEKIATALNAKLTPAETKAVASVPTHNKQAYEAYMRGTYYLYDAQGKDRPSEFALAVTFLQQAVEHDPQFADAFSALAASYRHMGGHDAQAEAAARRALALNPGSTFAHIQMARLLGQEGKFDEALKLAQAALKLEPTNGALVNGLGNIYVDAGRYDEALDAYRRAIALVKDEGASATPKGNMAEILASQRHFADARDTLEDVLAHDPSRVNAASLLAIVYVAGWGNLDSARKTLEAVPMPVASSGALSDAWYRLDLYARDYAAALKVIGGAPTTWFVSEQRPLGLYQGKVYQAQGDAVHAAAAFAKARAQLGNLIKASPDNAELHANLAQVLAGLGEREEAIKEARRAVSLQPSEAYPQGAPDRLANLAEVESRIGDAGAAVTLLDRLFSMPVGLSVSVSLLRIDPAWDPIRHDPRFQALLKKYQDTQSAAATRTVAGD